MRYGSSARIDLKGGLRISRKRRSVSIRSLHAFSAAGKPALLRGKVGKRTLNLFRVKGGKRTYDPEAGELSRVGLARLTPAGAKLLNRNLRTGRKKLKSGMVWGYFNLYALYKVTEVEDPTGEIPVVPPVKAEPSGALPVESAVTIKWYVRDSFINYIASGTAPGDGTRVENGATADAPSGPFDLAYSFNFPFASGWTVPATDDDPENTLVKGTGAVGFRYCQNTINFTAGDPEIEIDGDANSRLIFHVNGTDGTPFPDQRAVMVKLLPSKREAYSKTSNGTFTTVTYEKIPGYIPAEATGIFAGFYEAYDPMFVTTPNGFCPDSEGEPGICTEANRPDRFGFFSITYRYADPGT